MMKTTKWDNRTDYQLQNRKVVLVINPVYTYMHFIYISHMIKSLFEFSPTDQNFFIRTTKIITEGSRQSVNYSM